MKNNRLPLNIKFLMIMALLSSVAFYSCQKKIEQEIQQINPSEKIAPDGFAFVTSKTVAIDITVQTNTNKAIKGVPLSVYTIKSKGVLGEKIYTGFSDASGRFIANISVPASIDTLIIDPNYLGLLKNAKAVIRNNAITGTIGGSKTFAGSIVGSLSIVPPAYERNYVRSNSNMKSAATINGVQTNTIFSYLSPYDADGRPTVMEPNDDIEAEMLDNLNSSLPETEDVRDHHPEYLMSNASTNIVIEKRADVWVTFVSEGAGYRNSIGYYTYPTSTPPRTLSDITNVKFFFANASLDGSDGTLVSGNKVRLGNFNPGTSIGFVIFANGWDGTKVDTDSDAFFSNDILNPESTADLRRHTVLLRYKNRYIIGFDDIKREWAGSDHDFNDVLIFASANPSDAISNDNVQQVDTPNDADGDGVTDLLDEFPNDSKRAYTNYYPTKTTWASIAFEDQWPVSGDYDLNDLVVKYQYKWVSSGSNEVVDLYGSFAPIASGATFQNGFGVQLPFASNKIQSVTGYRHTDNYIRLNANGTEASQSNAVIVPFDNCRSLIRPISAASPMINTDMALGKVTGDTVRLTIALTSPISNASFGSAPFNPFIICDKKRGFEVHLPGMLPTDLIDRTQFGKGVDNTTPGSNIYFVTKQNYPWALNFMDNFVYPVEQQSIGNAYLKFFGWAASGGRDFRDWNTNTASGYRSNSLLFTK